MKMIKKNKGIVRYLMLCALIVFGRLIYGQTPETVVSNTEAFSPSITSFESGGDNALVSAYAFKEDATHRSVEVKRSTDHGQTWSSAISILKPKWSDGSRLENMDDPQILCTDGEKIVLVVRAWSDNSSTMIGAAFQEQPKSVYKKCGIYMCISSDGGQNWGYYSSSTYTANEWATIEENADHSTNSITLEYPRIAWRKNFDITSGTNHEKGYVTWTKKEYSVSGSTLTVDDASIGIRCFNGGGTIANGYHGQLIGSNTYPTLTYRTSSTPGPERTSVALSPDGGIWLGYYSVDYSNSVAYFYYAKGRCNTSGAFTFSGGGTLYKSAIPLPGTYDNTRGYIYLPSTDFGNHWDIAQGPSIQVASREPQFNCFPDYQLGYAHVQSPISSAVSESEMHVSFSEVKYGASESSVSWGGEETPDASTDRLLFYPVLKYIDCDEWRDANGAKILNYRTTYGTPSRTKPSFFILSFMHGSIISGDFSDLACKSAISFTNTTFYSDAKLAEPLLTGNASTTGYFGTKMDVAGGASGKMHAYPIYHKFTTSGSSDNVSSNECGGVFYKAYFDPLPFNHPFASPTMGWAFDISGDPTGVINYRYFDFDDIDGSKIVTPTISIIQDNWLGEWNRATTTSITFNRGNYGLRYARFKPENEFQGQLKYSCQRKAVTAGNVTFAVSEKDSRIVFNQTRGLGVVENINPGDLYQQIGWSASTLIEDIESEGLEQTHPSISVYQDGTSLAPFSSDFSGKGAIAVTWVEKKPSTCMTGKLVSIKLRTMEFDMCSGAWGKWSPVYTIHTHLAKPEQGADVPDNTMPVISPIIKPVFTTTTPPFNTPKSDYDHPQIGVPTYLLGWTVTWTGPRLTTVLPEGYDEECGEDDFIDAYVALPRSFTGLYSRSMVRTDALSTNLLANESWPLDEFAGSSPVFYPITPKLEPPESATTEYNEILNTQTTTNLPYVISFPSVVNRENKHTWWGTTDNYRQHVSFSSGGTGYGIWGVLIGYDLFGPNYCSKTSQNLMTISGGSRAPNDWIKEKNPSITVNSSGQSFVAWERITRENIMDPEWNHIIDSKRFSSILVRKTQLGDVSKQSLITHVLRAEIINLSTHEKKSVQNLEWEYLLNPSITAFPKTQALNVLKKDGFGDIQDRDFGNVELLYWANQVQDLSGISINGGRNDVRGRYYFEAPWGEGFPAPRNKTQPTSTGGNWPIARIHVPEYESDADYYTQKDRIWTQRSFSPRQKSFNVYSNFDEFDEKYFCSLELTNGSPETPESGIDLGVNQFWNYRFDAYTYKGTRIDTSLEDSYVGEVRHRDTVPVQFEWGAVYVGDTVGSGMRRVFMGYPEDTTSSATYDTYRDSVFRTELFDWPAGKTIEYDRTLFWGDSAAILPGGLLADTSVRIKYRVELIKDTSVITIEELVFAPSQSKFIKPRRITLSNSGISSVDVYLRVRKIEISGFSDSANQKQLLVISNLGGRHSDLGDTSIVAFKFAEGAASFQENSLNVLPPFPNPSLLGSHEQTAIYLAYPKGQSVSIDILDPLGRTVARQLSITSLGEWQKVPLKMPETSGAYFIKVKAGRYIKTLPISVVK